MQIRRLADLLPGGLEHVYGFSCQCVCGETVQLSAADFDHQGGAWVDGHGDDQTAGSPDDGIPVNTRAR